MYRILLVDDDPILLSGIKHLIDWEKNKCQITGTASNGEEALKKTGLLKPDIVICDIAMPGVTGLELLKQTEAQYPEIVFIMLTNYEEFEYVRKSLQYRAVEYLIKTNLTQEILEKALARAIAERENRNKLYRVKEADDLLHSKRRQERILQALNNLLYRSRPLANEDRTILLNEGMLSCFAFALIPVNISILPEYPGIPAEEQAKIIDWETEIIEHLAASFFPSSLVISASPDTQSDESDINIHELLLFAWNLPDKAWETDIARFREHLIKTSIQITRLGVDVIASCFFNSCDTEKNPFQVLQQIKTEYYLAGKGVHSDTIQKALHYILNNVEKRIMLQDVADFACISPGYLSTMFKREFKQNLMDFINQTKIDRACELIKENKYRINEISSLLGFENAFYFSRVFRRHTGTTPSEFREANAQLDKNRE